MKAVLVVFVFAACAFAQDQSALASAQSACGPAEVQFDTKTAKNEVPTQPEAGKSLVYVVEVFDKVVGEIGHPTLRVGVDGKWAGADKDNSYLSFAVDPGEHHLCTNWQSSKKRPSKEAAFTSFTADSGKTYYFRARITEHGGSVNASNFSLDLEPVNGDEGRYLVASSAVAVSQPKK